MTLAKFRPYVLRVAITHVYEVKLDATDGILAEMQVQSMDDSDVESSGKSIILGSPPPVAMNPLWQGTEWGQWQGMQFQPQQAQGFLEQMLGQGIIRPAEAQPGTQSPQPPLPRGLTVRRLATVWTAICIQCNCREEAIQPEGLVPDHVLFLPDGWEEIDWNVAVPVTFMQMIDGPTQGSARAEIETIRAVICTACFAARNAPAKPAAPLPPPDFFPVSRGRVPELAETPEDKTLRLLTDPEVTEAMGAEASAAPEDI